jgi:SpoVK/Ycf46/Vps4 family AAA+-type ATPase
MAEQHTGQSLADAGMSQSATEEFQLTGFVSGREHLLAELKRLDLMLQRQVIRLRAANLLTEDDFRGLYIPDAQVDSLLNRSSPVEGDARQPGGDGGLNRAQALTLLIEQLRKENQARVRASHEEGALLPLVRLSSIFNLTPFEVEVLLLCIAPEVDLKYETLYAYVQNDFTRKRPTVDLALRLFCPTLEARLDQYPVFAEEGILFHHQLLRLFDDAQDREPTLLMRYLKMDQRICDFILDQDKIDSRLLPFTSRASFTRQWSNLILHANLKTRLAQATRSIIEGGWTILFHGPNGCGKQATAAAMCAEQNVPLLVADLRQAMTAERPLAQIIILLQREAALSGSALYLNHFETLSADEAQLSNQRPTLSRLLSSSTRPIFLGSETRWHPSGQWHGVRFLSFDFPLPDFPARVRLWEEALGDGQRLQTDVDLRAIANKFVLSAGQILHSAREAAHLAEVRPPDQQEISMEDLHTAARNQSNQGLRRLAQKIENFYQWSDIVLPPRAMQQLREVCDAVKYRHLVHSDWGFERKLAMGKGLNVLFSGSSGTGKTMAAQIVACELSLDLYKIDLSSVVSKYIGETEKNLNSIFQGAQASNTILFFDEADALFGKRSEVKDAHDRYANIEVAYLLQKMEEYEGIAILATNLSKNLDEAFARRMHHTVEFPFPDAIHRERIWRGLFPSQAPLADDVDLRFLARQFELAGGNIRNIVLAAALMAAASGASIQMQHLILATAREWQKMGKLPARSDFRNYYELIRERG